jgi:hypothetical protein
LNDKPSYPKFRSTKKPGEKKIVVPWFVTGNNLKNNPGKVTLRPWGTSRESQENLEPKLEFSEDENRQMPWSVGDPYIKEIIFEVTDKQKLRPVPVCPHTHPGIEPSIPRQDTTPAPTSTPTPANGWDDWWKIPVGAVRILWEVVQPRSH